MRGGAAWLVGGATVADVRRTGERNNHEWKAVGKRVKGVGDATIRCWANGAESSIWRKRRKKGRRGRETVYIGAAKKRG